MILTLVISKDSRCYPSLLILKFSHCYVSAFGPAVHTRHGRNLQRRPGFGKGSSHNIKGNRQDAVLRDQVDIQAELIYINR